jgi:hypothetical protein
MSVIGTSRTSRGIHINVRYAERSRNGKTLKQMMALGHYPKPPVRANASEVVALASISCAHVLGLLRFLWRGCSIWLLFANLYEPGDRVRSQHVQALQWPTLSLQRHERREG